jgi:ribosomal RNA-processing protein 8
MGCGDAQLARALTPSAKKLQLRLLSYDLHAPDPLITKADVANLPLADGTVDIAVFCLSLMGTNWVSFVEEAYRVLRGDGKGECWVSEVKSRFGRVNRKKAQIGLKKQDMSNTQKKKANKKKKGGKGGGDDDDEGFDDEDDIYAEDANNQNQSSDETDTSAFVEVFRSRGFVLKQESVDKSNKMFIKMEFVKAGGSPTKGKYAGVVPSGKPAPVQTKKKFIDHDTDVKGMTAEEEAKVLKPCVYKIR